MERKISFEEAKNRYPHRFTMEHVPSHVLNPRPSGDYYAPQYRTDREWYDNTCFPGEDFGDGLKVEANSTSCYSINQSFPLGYFLMEPYQIESK